MALPLAKDRHIFLSSKLMYQTILRDAIYFTKENTKKPPYDYGGFFLQV